MAFLNLITELGYREDKMWSSEEEEQLQKILDLASKHTKWILKEVKNWKKDGKP